jgi:hypothetical protein
MWPAGRTLPRPGLSEVKQSVNDKQKPNLVDLLEITFSVKMANFFMVIILFRGSILLQMNIVAKI